MYKKDFPIFDTYPDLVFLDSASSAQKPRVVIDAIQDMLVSQYANIHRGAYDLSERAEHFYDESKKAVAKLIGATSQSEIVYTYNATYAFNLLSRSLIKSGYLEKGDHILLSFLDHHANIVPWQILSEEYGIIIDWIDITPDGRLDLSYISEQLSRVKLVSVTAASNVTGAKTDLSEIHRCIDQLGKDILFVVDGSQSLPHFCVDVVELGIDFFIATGHKIMSDTGIGILYGKKKLLQSLIPAFSGGGSINSVKQSGYEPAGLPYRYEPGTPHIVGARSLLAAIDYIDTIGSYTAIEKYEQHLIEYTIAAIARLPDTLELVGPREAHHRIGVFSFRCRGYHPSDIAERLALTHICVRAGHHCAEPLHDRLGIPASLRMSLALYNTESDIDAFIDTLIRTCTK